MQLNKILEECWYQTHISRYARYNHLLLSVFLFPFSIIFSIIVKVRYYLYKFHILKSYHLPVPVVIVGNITVGGVGKTPITKHLAHELIKSGIKVGIILRGYKANNLRARVIHASDHSVDVGDEALIYASNNIPVAIGANRYHAGLALLKEYPDIQLILSDDGLQHYRLQRDYEIAVIDKNFALGNGHLLPWGPLREPENRLKSVDAIIINLGAETTLPGSFLQDKLSFRRRPESSTPQIITHTLTLDKIYNPITNQTISIESLQQHHITAMAAIGNPDRFFNFLKQQHITLDKTIFFPDHYHYKIEDIPQNSDILLVTEKDYTKLASFNNPKIWVVLVQSSFNDSRILQLISQLSQRHTHSTC